MSRHTVHHAVDGEAPFGTDRDGIDWLVTDPDRGGGKGPTRLTRVRNALNHIGSKKLIVPSHGHDGHADDGDGGARIVRLARGSSRGHYHATAFDPVSDGCVPRPFYPSVACLNAIAAHRRLRRHHFELLAGRYLLPLCDQFTAGTVFDALVEESRPVDITGAWLCLNTACVDWCTLCGMHSDGHHGEGTGPDLRYIREVSKPPFDSAVARCQHVDVCA